MTGLLISMETIPVYPWHSFFCHASFYHRAKRAKVTISTMLAAGGKMYKQQKVSSSEAQFKPEFNSMLKPRSLSQTHYTPAEGHNKAQSRTLTHKTT